MKRLSCLLCLAILTVVSITSTGCVGAGFKVKKDGNGEYYVEWGIKIAMGHHTEIADERQKDSTEAEFYITRAASESE